MQDRDATERMLLGKVSQIKIDARNLEETPSGKPGTSLSLPALYPSDLCNYWSLRSAPSLPSIWVQWAGTTPGSLLEAGASEEEFLAPVLRRPMPHSFSRKEVLPITSTLQTRKHLA